MPGLLRATWKLTRSRDAAQELVHEAYLLIAIGRRRWNPAQCPNLFTFVMGVIKSMRSHEAREAAREDGITDPDDEPAAPPSEPTPEVAAILKAQERRNEAMRVTLRSAVEGDPICIAILDSENDDHAAIAKRMGVPESDVTKAWRRLTYTANKLARDVPMERRPLEIADEEADVARDLAESGIDLDATLSRLGAALEKAGVPKPSTIASGTIALAIYGIVFIVIVVVLVAITRWLAAVPP
jgi:DNA-directed RNA polymerase specialized sigma24 family protein